MSKCCGECEYFDGDDTDFGKCYGMPPTPLFVEKGVRSGAGYYYEVRYDRPSVSSFNRTCSLFRSVDRES